MYSNAQYVNDLSGTTIGINVEINGIMSFVPIDPENTDYAAIQKLVAEGKLTIAPAEETK